ncbi:MAG: GNAT family N-acetyltransferase [Chitinophagaceae bacterium]|jgi:N-acetylglutamate synthase-like GNAT family acetyltransferase|nr:GNAT family N-acetyltransferase [Chitinophagaceae bacterium]
MIRTATISDIPTIRSIAERTWPSTYGGIISQGQIDYMLDLMYSNESLTKQIQSNHQFYIFEFDNNPIAFASVSKEEEGIFKLNKLYVLPNIQKTGAGKALLAQVKNYAKANGGKHLILQVNKHNNAKAFYEHMGFSVQREMIFELDHGYVMDDYIMEIQL